MPTATTPTSPSGGSAGRSPSGGFDAVVLAGGASSRLVGDLGRATPLEYSIAAGSGRRPADGPHTAPDTGPDAGPDTGPDTEPDIGPTTGPDPRTDKTRMSVGGRPLLELVLAAVAEADRVVVVGDPRPTQTPVTWRREQPLGGGPAAGLVAGLSEVRAERVVVLAGDLAGIDATTVTRLLTALDDSGADGALLVDADGRRQHLTGAHTTEALRRAAARRDDWTDAAVHRLLEPLRIVTVPAAGDEARDVDTAADLDAARSARHEPPGQER